MQQRGELEVLAFYLKDGREGFGEAETNRKAAERTVIQQNGVLSFKLVLEPFMLDLTLNSMPMALRFFSLGQFIVQVPVWTTDGT